MLFTHQESTMRMAYRFFNERAVQRLYLQAYFEALYGSQVMQVERRMISSHARV